MVGDYIAEDLDIPTLDTPLIILPSSESPYNHSTYFLLIVTVVSYHFSGSQPCKRIVRGIGCSLQNWLIPGLLTNQLVPCSDKGLLRISHRDLDVGAYHLTSGCRVVVLFSVSYHRRRRAFHPKT